VNIGKSKKMKDLSRFLRFADKKDLEHLVALKAAIFEHEGHRRGTETIQKYLSDDRLGDFNLVNPYPRKVFRKHLLLEVADLENPTITAAGVVMLATFADREWACCDRAYDFDFGKARQKVRNAFAGMDFIAVIEAGVYPESKWTTGKTSGCLVSFHCHAMVWSTSKSKLRRHKQAIAARFEPVFEGETTTYPVLNDLKAIADVLRVLRYMSKLPLEGYRKERKGGKVSQEHAELEAGHHYRLFKFLRVRSLFDAWFAGGEGSAILRQVRRKITSLPSAK
jgi:hypothetical protein